MAVVVFRIGKAPINYRANIFSYATFITVILYISAIIFPYVISGLCYRFFTRYEIEPQIPSVYINPDIECRLTSRDGNTNLYFKMNEILDESITRVPVIQIPQLLPTNSLKFAAYFPLHDDEIINRVQLSFTFVVNFTKKNKAFTSYVDINEFAFLRTSSINIFGSLLFTQEKVLNGYYETDVPLSNEYIQYTRKRAIKVNSSYPVTRGDPIFLNRNTIFTFGPTKLYEVHFSMRVPVVKTYVQTEGFYSFLDGWSSYLSFALPLFIIVRITLSALYRSNIIPVQRECEVDLNTEKMPKLNR